ncbi:MAG: outer membrane lipoprotein-sorting protein [Pseudomonadales bacterium]|nr:outer membrane lipoprotein-sorting protein [Pseudomonadales bacterium]
MKYILLCLSLISPCLWAMTDPMPSAEELINTIDDYRGYGDAGFSLKTTTVSYKNNREPLTSQVSVQVLGEKSHITFEAPAREKGRIILSRDNNMWISFPNTRKVVRISPSQKLLGEASNGDILGTALSRDYSATILGESQVDGIEAIELELVATNKKASYPRIVFYIDKTEQHKPLKSDYYARSGKLLKTAFYKGFIEVNGEQKIHKMLFVNPLIEGSYTWMRFDHLKRVDLPESLFNKSALTK